MLNKEILILRQCEVYVAYSYVIFSTEASLMRSRYYEGATRRQEQ